MPSLALKNTMTNTKWMTDFSVAPMTQHQSSIKHFLNYSYWNGAIVQQQWDFCDGKILLLVFTVLLFNIKAEAFCWAKWCPGSDWTLISFPIWMINLQNFFLPFKLIYCALIHFRFSISCIYIAFAFIWKSDCAALNPFMDVTTPKEKL